MGLPGAPGAPGARVNRNKNFYCQQGPIKRQRRGVERDGWWGRAAARGQKLVLHSSVAENNRQRSVSTTFWRRCAMTAMLRHMMSRF